MPTVHQATWGLIRALGVHKVFGNPGSTAMPFLADFPEDLDYVLGLHEGAVVGMADVYAQLTGEPTLVNLHTAVGLGNAMGAIINAASGHSPLAKGYGIPAVRTGRPDELAIALKQAFTAGNGPHMIIVDIEPGVPLGG